MKWISVKDHLPEKDCVCVVWNSSRPFDYYISSFNRQFKEFEVSQIGAMIRLPNCITFNATHWMELEIPTNKMK